MKSTDGGDTWTKYDEPSGNGASYQDLYFFNKDNGIVAGLYSDGFLIKTNDGGQSSSTDFGDIPYPASYFTINADR
jgi:photosystem II stability/assembly factor-like uncharacterized protein